LCSSCPRRKACPQKRMADIRHVHAYLMRPPQSPNCSAHAYTVISRYHLIVRHRAAGRPLCHALLFLSVRWRPIGASIVPMSSRILPKTTASYTLETSWRFI
jgi:hypothetical protein